MVVSQEGYFDTWSTVNSTTLPLCSFGKESKVARKGNCGPYKLEICILKIPSIHVNI